MNYVDLTILKDAIEGTLVGVGEEPIQVVQLYVQHWYQPE